MPDKTCAGPVNENCGTACQTVKEAVCIHTKKIFDACRDKDCIENLRVFFCRECQTIIDSALTVKGREAELIDVYIDVEPIQFNRGFFTVDATFFYKVTVDISVGRARPVACIGLTFFNKRIILFGSESTAKIFRSSCDSRCAASGMPTAVVEAVDPIILDAKVVEACEGACECICELPGAISDVFEEDLVFGDERKVLYVTLGQFSIIRLERDTQILIPAYDYCIPQKECTAIGVSAAEACDVFKSIRFPTEEFFPQSECQIHEDIDCTCCC